MPHAYLKIDAIKHGNIIHRYHLGEIRYFITLPTPLFHTGAYLGLSSRHMFIYKMNNNSVQNYISMMQIISIQTYSDWKKFLAMNVKRSNERFLPYFFLLGLLLYLS